MFVSFLLVSARSAEIDDLVKSVQELKEEVVYLSKLVKASQIRAQPNWKWPWSKDPVQVAWGTAKPASTRPSGSLVCCNGKELVFGTSKGPTTVRCNYDRRKAFGIPKGPQGPYLNGESANYDYLRFGGLSIHKPIQESYSNLNSENFCSTTVGPRGPYRNEDSADMASIPIPPTGPYRNYQIIKVGAVTKGGSTRRGSSGIVTL